MAKTHEKDVLLDHNYDGIQELDNDLPPWWLWLFYVSIIWSAIYLIHYHVIGTGDSSAVEYEKEINPQWEETIAADEYSIGYRSPYYKAGEELTPLLRIQIALAQEKEAALLAAQNEKTIEEIKIEDIGFDEIIIAAMRVASPENLAILQNAFPEIYTTYEAEGKGKVAPESTEQVASVEPLTDAESLSAGEAVFITNCATCHGKLGEGGIGPNMTDNYYIHGSGINNMIKIINVGVPAKGMISWRGILKDDQILQVASYILTLKGSNPPNAKAPQGEKAE